MNRHLDLFLFSSLLHMIDWRMTKWALETGGFREANPRAVWLFEQYGLDAGFWMKMSVIIVNLFLYVIVYRLCGKMGERWFAGFFGAVMLFGGAYPVIHNTMEIIKWLRN